MILGFKPQFEDKIIRGEKIHTIRADPGGRWKSGNKIHFATGVRTKKYRQFKEGICTGVQSITINYSGIEFGEGNYLETNFPDIKIDGRRIEKLEERRKLALLDGFNSIPQLHQFFSQSFAGKIIHWTDYRYS